MELNGELLNKESRRFYEETGLVDGTFRNYLAPLLEPQQPHQGGAHHDGRRERATRCWPRIRAVPEHYPQQGGTTHNRASEPRRRQRIPLKFLTPWLEFTTWPYAR